MKILTARSLGLPAGLLCLACISDAAQGRSAPAVAPERCAPERAARGQQLAPNAPADTASDSALPDASSEREVLNQGGLQGLLGALSDVVAVELVDFRAQPRRQVLGDSDRKQLLDIIARGALIDAHSVTHPPWPASFIFYTQTHGSYAVTLVGSENLRLDPGNEQMRFVGDAARWNDAPAPEMVLQVGASWVWQYLEERLGKPSKEYTVPDVPMDLRRPPPAPGQ